MKRNILAKADRGLIGKVGLTTLTRIALVFAGLITSVLTARVLGPADRGQYFYIITLANIAVQAGSLGQSANNSVSVARRAELMPRLAANTLWISIFFGVLATMGILTYEAVNGETARLDLAWTLFAMVPAMLYGLLASNLLLGMSLVGRFNLYILASTSIQLIGIAAGALVWGTIEAVLWASAASALLGSVLLWHMLRNLGATEWNFDKGLFRSGVGYAGRVYLITLIGYLVSRLGIILLDRWSSPEEVGQYSIAVQFADTLLIIPGATALVILPKLASSASSGVFTQTLRIAGITAILMAVLCATVAAAAIWVIPFLFGIEFTRAVAALWWLLPGTFALSVATMFSQYLSVNGVPIANIVIWVLSLVLFVLMGQWLIPLWGASGAAASLTAAYGLLLAGLITAAVAHHRAAPLSEGRKDSSWT
ncbi:MAG TPA: oligosaccharide flippase family protein [Bryobacteraceae bacterium]|nr:oligosaccharide flippase family protein [Bryobacteraceae bacterium]